MQPAWPSSRQAFSIPADANRPYRDIGKDRLGRAYPGRGVGVLYRRIIQSGEQAGSAGARPSWGRDALLLARRVADCQSTNREALVRTFRRRQQGFSPRAGMHCHSRARARTWGRPLLDNSAGDFRSRRREASAMVEDSTACFAELVDPGVMRRCDHRLIDILMIAVSACAESWCRAVLLGCLANYCAMFRTSP